MIRRQPLPLSLEPLDRDVKSGGNGDTYRLKDGNGYWRVKFDRSLQSPDQYQAGAVELARMRYLFRARWAALNQQIVDGRTQPMLLRVSAWPEKIGVRRDANGASASGIVMRNIEPAKPLHSFLHRKLRRRNFPDATDRDAVKAAWSLAEAVRVVHGAGYLIRDFQPQNALVTPDYRVILIDTDSFVRQDAPEPLRHDLVYSPYRAPEIVAIECGETFATQNHDLFALATLLFGILMAEEHAFDAFYVDTSKDPDIDAWIRDCRFPHSMRRPMTESITFSDGCPAFSDLPEPIRNLFERAFAPEGRMQRPLASEWTQALERWAQAGVKPWSMAPLPPPAPPPPTARKAIPAPKVMQPPPVPPKQQPTPAAPYTIFPAPKAPVHAALPHKPPPVKPPRKPVITPAHKAALATGLRLVITAGKKAQEAATIVGWFGVAVVAMFFLNSLPTSLTTGPFVPNAAATTSAPALSPAEPPITPDEAAWSQLSGNPTFRGMYEFHKAYGGTAHDTREAYASLFETAAERNGVTGVGNQWRTHSDMALYALPDESSDLIATIPAETTVTALGQMTYYGTWVIVSLKQFGPDGAWEYGFLHVTRSDDENGTGDETSSFTDGAY